MARDHGWRHKATQLQWHGEESGLVWVGGIIPAVYRRKIFHLNLKRKSPYGSGGAFGEIVFNQAIRLARS